MSTWMIIIIIRELYNNFFFLLFCLNCTRCRFGSGSSLTTRSSFSLPCLQFPLIGFVAIDP